ncbi:MAG: hypothetical protein GWM98_00940, partial [Nitrospinaceae bacterium]|nr:hypothetical protein [Nitrospinaceae bacterium]NIR53333.1 hypothetical protein [Nitrospinaceae bacterium]NIS83735.1 hypothetical protein [Nitrospinaceae bacterium]NIT80532.1 hypothetical protein [Nitrospinaceae bacterium]NIU42859.1 hypothetical protein [Nitrospinaceae bacterium]
MNVLEQVTTQSRDDELVLRFQFQNPVSGVEDPEFFQKIIQLQIPRATLRSERKSYRTDDEWVPHVFVSNTGSGSLQARFILGREFQN